LIVFIDHNKLQSYGRTTEVLDMSPLPEKWQSFGFNVHEIDGHNIEALEELLKTLPVNIEKPTVVICHTIKGKGFPFAEGNPNWHHKSGLKEEDILEMYKCLE
jgi:transketolase